MVGNRGDRDEFCRRFDHEVRKRRIDRGVELGIEKLDRIGAEVAVTSGVAAVVGAPDSSGTARIRELGADGRILPGSIVALGSGAEVALGRIDAAVLDREVEAIASLVEDVVDTVARKDPETGDGVAVWTLESAERANDAGGTGRSQSGVGSRDDA